MKTALIIAMTCTLAMVLVRGDEPFNSTDPLQEQAKPAPVPLDSPAIVQAPKPQAPESSTLDKEAPNEIVLNKLTLKGAAIQWFKTDNLLQLFNPFAPARYGKGDQNLSYDIITDKPKGITILAIEWGGARDR